MKVEKNIWNHLQDNQKMVVHYNKAMSYLSKRYKEALKEVNPLLNDYSRGSRQDLVSFGIFIFTYSI